MLVEYKIKFEKDGVTITQRIEQSATSRPAQTGVPGKVKSAQAVGDTVGDGLQDDGDTGGGPGSGRVIAFGPVIFCGSSGTSAVAKKDKDEAAEGKPAPPIPAPATPKNQ